MPIKSPQAKRRKSKNKSPVKGMGLLKTFKHMAPRKLGAKLLQRFGVPDAITIERAQALSRNGVPLGAKDYVSAMQWDNIKDGQAKVSITLRDEFIKHSFPRPHHDFIYTTASLKLSPEHASMLPFVTGSILVDLLKHQVTARCGGLKANSVTLGFVYDLSKNKLRGYSKSDLKKEYARRITKGILGKYKLE